MYGDKRREVRAGKHVSGRMRNIFISSDIPLAWQFQLFPPDYPWKAVQNRIIAVVRRYLTGGAFSYCNYFAYIR